MIKLFKNSIVFRAGWYHKMETIQYCFKLQYCYHHKGQLLHILLSCYCTSVHLSQVKLFSSNWLLTPSIKVGWYLPINFWLSRISGMEYWNDPNCVLYLPKSQNGINLLLSIRTCLFVLFATTCLLNIGVQSSARNLP